VNIRDENVLRELNLYPLWVRRDMPVADAHEAPVSAVEAPGTLGGGEADTQQSEMMGIVEPVLSADEGINPSYVSALDWNELKQTVHDCTACKLRAGCTQTVFGVGDEKAEWMFVGEGPGADEDAQGEPFVGQAGKLLDNMLAAIKLKRGNNVYIGNIVKCRPPNNRTPEPDEIATCLPYLQQQIALIKPKLIVALGKTAATSLLGREATLGSMRGTIHNFHGTPLIVTYHPAYLLRSPAEKAKAWQDLCFAVKRMAE
jgi:DNA polymerase